MPFRISILKTARRVVKLARVYPRYYLRPIQQRVAKAKGKRSQIELKVTYSYDAQKPFIPKKAIYRTDLLADVMVQGLIHELLLIKARIQKYKSIPRIRHSENDIRTYLANKDREMEIEEFLISAFEGETSLDKDAIAKRFQNPIIKYPEQSEITRNNGLEWEQIKNIYALRFLLDVISDFEWNPHGSKSLSQSEIRRDGKKTIPPEDLAIQIVLEEDSHMRNLMLLDLEEATQPLEDLFLKWLRFTHNPHHP